VKNSKYSPIHWTKFVREQLPPITAEMIRMHAKELNMTYDDAKRAIESVVADEIWGNSLYQVNIRTILGAPDLPRVKHLSIKRRDKKVIHDWRHLQRIKNELVGSECEAIEIYPAESRLVDTSNQYHLWVFDDPNHRIGLGFGDRMVLNTSKAGAVQRKRN
jgi:hypothetical protein